MPVSLIEYQTPPKPPGPSQTLGRDALAVSLVAAGFALVVLLCGGLVLIAGDDLTGVLVIGYIAGPATMAFGFVAICLAVVNLYDHAGKDRKSRLALAVAIATIVGTVVPVLWAAAAGVIN